MIPHIFHRVIVEVFSIFTVNKTGKICIHKMDKVNVIVCALYVTETGTKHFDIKHT